MVSNRWGLPDRVTVHHVRIKWGQILNALESDIGDEPLTIYRFERPHVLGLSPALYARFQSLHGEPAPEPPVIITGPEASPWRPDFTDPSAPTRVAIDSRGAQQSWPEIHTNVARRRMHITVRRNGRPAAVFVPLDWPPVSRTTSGSGAAQADDTSPTA